MVVKAELNGSFVITENSDKAMELWHKSRYGIKAKEGRVQLSLLEGLHLVEIGKLKIKDGRKVVQSKKLFAYAKRREKNFEVRYKVYRDLRSRGYIIKTALKFGADFRVYPRGVKPGEDHARWIVYPVYESDPLTWCEFAAKARVAHSTKKKLMMGIVDAEDSITYYEIGWKKP